MKSKLKELRLKLKALETELKINGDNESNDLRLQIDKLLFELGLMKQRAAQIKALHDIYELEQIKPQPEDFEDESAFNKALESYEKLFFSKNRAYEKRFKNLIVSAC